MTVQKLGPLFQAHLQINEVHENMKSLTSIPPSKTMRPQLAYKGPRDPDRELWKFLFKGISSS